MIQPTINNSIWKSKIALPKGLTVKPQQNFINPLILFYDSYHKLITSVSAEKTGYGKGEAEN